MIVLLVYKPIKKRARIKDSWNTAFGIIGILTPALIASSFTALLFALQMGGIVYRWPNARIIGCLVVFGGLAAIFIVIQWLRPDQ